jgi:hypothetical protein
MRRPIELARGTRIGRFGLIRELGRGGMGQVFLARDTQLGRKVAIKFLLRDDVEFVRRFTLEARATARCVHENIVTIHEVGEHDGLPYIVLEYLEGKPLERILADGHVSPRELAEMLVSVARALGRAHEHGIVHRDLKPSNIFVTERGQVKVLDFGIACLLESPLQAVENAARPSAVLDAVGDVWADTPSETGELIGTVPYMSPEQFGLDEIDHRSDLWAIGIICWRAFAVHHPAGTVVAEELGARFAQEDRPLPSIATYVPSLAPALVHVVDRCLALRKADRYQSAHELVTDLHAYLAPEIARASDDACPYRGLSAFGENDARYFFGRSDEVRGAFAQLSQWPLLAVVGPSGVGKSSFVHAGLVPALRASGGEWQVWSLRPGRQPLQRLSALCADAIETGDPSGEVAVQLRESPGMLGVLLRRIAARTRRNVLVVVDQLEELFTLVDDPNVRHAFLAALVGAADDAGEPVRVVVSMRADFLDRMPDHGALLDELSRGIYFLSSPSPAGLREALVRPAELVGYGFEDERIVDDMMQVATSRGALPLLSFAASSLWDARDRERRQLTLAAYDEIGGVGGAFARHADRVAGAVPPALQPLLRAILARLVTADGTRALVQLRELRSLPAPSGDVDDICDRLVRARLLAIHTDPELGPTVELVHEMLIAEWPTLARVLRERGEHRGFLDSLRGAARQWASRGRPIDMVWRGAAAQEALAIARTRELELASDEREFLATARALLARGRRRIVIGIATIVAVLALVISGGAIAVVRISNAQREAEDHAASAARETKRALDATAEVARELEAVKAAQHERDVAEDTARGANEAVTESREQLVERNRDLDAALLQAKAANAEAAHANARLQDELAKQKLEVERLQREKAKIIMDRLH